MTVGNRISLTCAVLVGCTVTLGAVAILHIRDINQQVQSITHDSLPGIYEIGVMADSVGHLRALALMHIGAADPEKKAAFQQEIQKREQRFEQALKRYQETITTSRDAELFRAIPPAYSAYRTSIQEVLELSDGARRQQADDLYVRESRPRVLQLIEAINAEIEFNKQNGDARSEAAAAAVRSAFAWTGVLLVVTAGFGVGLTLFLVRGLNRTLCRAVERLEHGAVQVEAAAAQIASSSQVLAQGASEQAASLQQTTASSEQINAMAKKNTEHATIAAGVVDDSGRKFEAANQSLQAMVSAVAAIHAQSGKISQIIQTIDAIAFQTNILALNAAVEAARAGEAGMGFAVVADEVGTLAQRSAQAARDTSALIEESLAKSQEGKSCVDAVAAAIRDVAGESMHIKTLVGEVRASSQEQATGIGEMAKSIGMMEQVTQKSAANAEESAAAAGELTAQSAKLREVADELGALVGVTA